MTKHLIEEASWDEEFAFVLREFEIGKIFSIYKAHPGFSTLMQLRCRHIQGGGFGTGGTGTAPEHPSKMSASLRGEMRDSILKIVL